MKKLIGVLFIAAAASAPATAQEENKLSNAASPAAIQTNQVVPIQPGFKFVIEFPPTKFKTEGARRIGFPPEGFVVTQPQWVFKDGSLYIDIFGTGTLIPVPGGGASGCFDLDLQERIVKLRSRIEAFPPPPR
jgi:hypothetical protein